MAYVWSRCATLFVQSGEHKKKYSEWENVKGRKLVALVHDLSLPLKKGKKIDDC